MKTASLDELDARTRAWLDQEQTVNERLINPAYLPIDHSSNTVRPAYYPERRAVWQQNLTWLPRERTRVYGRLAPELHEAFGCAPPGNDVPLMLHPQTPPVHRRLAQTFGTVALEGVRATPTSSYRSVLAWRGDRPPVMLKLSIGATISRIWRALRENQVARAVLISRVLDTVPEAGLAEVGLDWFSEPAGMVETDSRHGWLLRRFPQRVGRGDGQRLIPMFSLISATPARPPLLVELIRRSGRAPEDYVLEKLVEPFVQAAAWLMFAQGIQVEVHAQNLMHEIDANGELSGRMVLRDLSDQSCSIPMRLAKGLPLPLLDAGERDSRPAFALATIATDVACNDKRYKLCRAFDTVERYGLWGFLWSLNVSLQRFFPAYDADRVTDIYLDWWQQLTVRYLGVRPLYTAGQPRGLAVDSALAHYLQHQVDWPSLGARPGHALPADAESLRLHRPPRRLAGPLYDRLECPWGDLYFRNNRPLFIRAAF